MRFCPGHLTKGPISANDKGAKILIQRWRYMKLTSAEIPLNYACYVG